HPLVRTVSSALLLLPATRCAPWGPPRDTPPTAPTRPQGPPVEPALPTSAPTPSIGGPPGIATPTLVPTPPPSLPPIREFAEIDFALMPGPSDLRIEAALSREDQEVVAATVAADIPAVEREFERTFSARPVIYVFGGTESYADGFVGIFGYPRATATFVAENSVSFFE